MTRLAMALVLVLMPAAALMAGDLTLAWDHSPSEGVTGYRVYCGPASGHYTRTEEAPYQTTWTVAGLAPGTWYCAVTAYNADTESEFSNEVMEQIPPPFSPCDLNRDRTVNVLDLQTLAHTVLYGTSDSEGDLNHDGVANVLDVQVLANVVLGVTSCPGE